ncbi:MAG TPA: formyltransferase family protein, partial [Polyangiaceae bacterium]
TLAKVRAQSPELLVSWFWTTKLPAALLGVAPGGAFGVHPSLLPRHRGPDPYFAAIDAGDALTGVTAHRLDGEYDTGAILAQRELPIDAAWSSWQLARALDRPSLALLRDIARGPLPAGTAQDETQATLAPTPADEELELDWSWPSERLLRRIRAAAPWPGAWTFFGEEAVTVVSAAPARSFPRALEPGEAAVVDGRAVIRTGDGALALLRGRMDAAEDEEPYDLDAGELALLVQDLQDSPA